MKRASLAQPLSGGRGDFLGQGEILREAGAEDVAAAEAEQGLRAVEDGIDPRILLN